MTWLKDTIAEIVLFAVGVVRIAIFAGLCWIGYLIIRHLT